MKNKLKRKFYIALERQKSAIRTERENRRKIIRIQSSTLQKAREQQARSFAKKKAQLEFQRKYERLKARPQLIPSTLEAIRGISKPKPIKKVKKKKRKGTKKRTVTTKRSPGVVEFRFN